MISGSKGVEGLAQLMARLPDRFSFKTDKVDIRAAIPNPRQHNEEDYQIVCGLDKSWLFHDHFEVDGLRTKNGYTLKFSFDADVGIYLFYDGMVTLTYDNATNRILMRTEYGGWFFPNEWKPCSPNGIINIIQSGLNCYRNDNSPSNNHDIAQRLLDILSENQASIIQINPLWNNEDCTKPPDPMDTSSMHDPTIPVL